MDQPLSEYNAPHLLIDFAEQNFVCYTIES